MSIKDLETFEAANETAARIDAMVELAREKGLVIGGLDVAADRIELPVVGLECDGEDVLSLEALRKDAERYRWFRNHSLQIVHASTGPWVHDLDKVVDEAMAAADVFDTPLLCRQRMAASGLPCPRSSCYSCGQFSPKWRECDAKIAALKVGVSK